MDDTTPVQPARGLLIVFEGLDRSGKSTQSRMLVDRLNTMPTVNTMPMPAETKESNDKPRAVLMRFPDRTTPTGHLIDAYLSNKAQVEDHVIHLLFSANRWERAQAIRDHLAAGTTVVCDRYTYSGVAYSLAKGLPWQWCEDPDVGLPAPDMVFFLTLGADTAAQRSGAGQERYENTEMQKRVRRKFRLVIPSEPLCTILDAQLPIEELHAIVVDRVSTEMCGVADPVGTKLNRAFAFNFPLSDPVWTQSLERYDSVTGDLLATVPEEVKGEGPGNHDGTLDENAMVRVPNNYDNPDNDAQGNVMMMEQDDTPGNVAQSKPEHKTGTPEHRVGSPGWSSEAEDALVRLGNGFLFFDATACTYHRDGKRCSDCLMAKALIAQTKTFVSRTGGWVFSDGPRKNVKPCVTHVLYEAGRCRGDRMVLNTIWNHVTSVHSENAAHRDAALALFQWYWRNGGYECMLLADPMCNPLRSELVLYADKHSVVVHHLAHASYDAFCEIHLTVYSHFRIGGLTRMVIDYMGCFVTEIRPDAEKLFPLSRL